MKADELYRVINGMERQLNILKNEADKLLNEVYLCGKADQQKETADHFADITKKVEEAYQKGYDEAKRIYQNPHAESDYQKELDVAWDAARKIAYMWTRMGNDEILAIFGITERIGYSTINSLFGKQTVNEAMLKLKAYEEKQKADDEIKVGDEVEVLNSGNKYLIAWFAGTSICGFAHDGVTCHLQPSDVRKTGRHFDIESILEAMKE